MYIIKKQYTLVKYLKKNKTSIKLRPTKKMRQTQTKLTRYEFAV